jgi:hypothetical protein
VTSAAKMAEGNAIAANRVRQHAADLTEEITVGTPTTKNKVRLYIPAAKNGGEQAATKLQQQSRREIEWPR